MVRLLRAAVLPALIAGMLSICGLTLGQLYAGNLIVVLVAGAALCSAVVGFAARPLPSWAVAPISVLALVSYSTFALLYSASRSGVDGGLGELAADAIVNGGQRLIAGMLPMEAQPDTVLVPVIATWLAGLTAVEVGSRARRATMSLIPPAVLYVAALILVGPHRSETIWASLAFAGLAATALAVTSRRTPSPIPQGLGGHRDLLDERTWRSLRLRAAVATAAGVAAILLIAGVAAVPLRGGVDERPMDPRAMVTPPQLDTLDENPLSRISGWAVTPDQHLLDASLSEDARIRLAVLTDYDGITWRVGGVYRPAAHTLPSPPAPPAPSPSPGGEGEPIDPGPATQVTQQITVGELSGKLLPVVGEPRRVDGVRVSLDPASGTLIMPGGLSAGMTYEVTSQRTTPDINVLPAAEVPRGPQMARYLAFAPTVPVSIQNVAQRLGGENAAPYQRALAIADFLATHYRLDAKAPSGHAYRNLEFFLFGPSNGGGRRGTSEQFAASFALIARMTGLPSRVVVGFSGRQGKHPVLAKDGYAWPEVLFAGVGWVAFDPLPQPDQKAEPLENEYEPKPEPSTPEPSEIPAPTVNPSAPIPTGAPTESSVPVETVAIVPIVGAGTGGLLILTMAALLLVVLSGRRALRRRRLEEGDAASRVAGAWLEVSDALRLAGARPRRMLSAREVAEHAATVAEPQMGHKHIRMPAPPLTELAGQVNLAMFAPEGTAVLDPRAAAVQATAYADELRARRSWWRRLIWTVHPGPLRWNGTKEKP